MGTTTSPDVPDLDRPVVKFRWLKRIGWAVGLLLLVLVCVRWWWGVYANRQLQAEIDRITAAGEPILLEDFAQPSIPDADNAAIPLIEAATIAESLAGPPLSPVDLAQIDDKRFFEAHARIKALIRDARSRRDCVWPVLRPVASGVDLAWHFLTYERPSVYVRLGRYLAEAAKRQHHAGNDAAAAETIGDMLFVARRLEAPPALLFGWLVANGVRAYATQSIQDLLASLNIAGSEAEAGIRPAARDQIEAMIGQLLDEAPSVECFAAALRAERRSPAEVGRAVSKRWFVGPGLLYGPGESVVWQRAAYLALKPAFVLDCVRAMGKADAVARAAMAPNRPDAQAALGKGYMGFSILHRANEFLSVTMDGPWRGTLDTRFRAAARNRMTAVALAMRLYELDHGRLPAKLDDLVPDYLAQLPADPFATDGRPIAYEPKAVAQSYVFYDRRTWRRTTVPPGPPHPVLYTVGPDGRDDRGSGRSFVYRPDSTGDTVFYLDEYRPESEASAAAMGMPVSPKAQEEDDEAADQEGDTDED